VVVNILSELATSAVLRVSSSMVIVSAERLAVQRRARRTNGSLMLLRFPCGGIVRCNGLLASIRHSSSMGIEGAEPNPFARGETCR